MFPIVYIITVWFQFLHRINAAFGVSQKFVPYQFPNPCKLYSDTSTTHNWCSFSIAQIPNGQYLLTVSGSDSVDNRRKSSLYIFSKYGSGTLYVLDAIKENAITTITSHSLSNEVLTLTFDALSYHGVSIARLSGW